MALIEGDLIMTSLEIAQLTGRPHSNVMQDIKSVLEEVGLGSLRFERAYVDEQHRERPCYHLPRTETLLLVTGYSRAECRVVVRRLRELELEHGPKQVTTSQTNPDALRAWAAELEEAEQIKLKAVEFGGKNTGTDATCSLGEFAESVGLTEQELVAMMVAKGVMVWDEGTASWLPRPEYIKAGYFVVKDRPEAEDDGENARA